MYDVMFKAKSTLAREFAIWITCEVLPRIRREAEFKLSDAA